ncbi:MAG TPA: nucleotidyl transferase AbiEii/AbiGii toxin family protein [Anaerolineales bacterium]|nr:nucleotidyl transferase AbiEii/AbiGii toxin family protein [Anaerolineales bacterium]
MQTDSPLLGKGLLTPIQKSFLSAFSHTADQEQFYLTGGTALAEFYLGHRYSFDLDFFTSIEGLILPVSYEIEKLGSRSDFDVSVTRRFVTYVELLVEQDGESLRVDLALDSPYRFAPAVQSGYGVYINDYKDLRVDKLLAYYGRAEPRDAMDLYFILQQEPLDPLLQQAKQKDAGFDLYWFAVALNRCQSFPDELERWPVKMLKPVNPIRVKAEFSKLAEEILSGLTSIQS